ncbi:GIY-YIG nuclease family protein [Shewanella baltica]|uniref:GIY-YIG nuclease family protein n=1 Tax=Shewanella baltica TaxID=62322 RepID=UPI000D1A1FB1|nr:GIY-YIG nuclease family protein [Shewanella baltica]AVT48985.1 hypothetical protein C8I07_15235 [Shewanella baltica]
MIVNMYVYHIRYKSDHNNIDFGYIGITNNPIRRKAEHWTALTLNTHKNYKLQTAFNEGPNEIELVIYKEFADRKSAVILEETLRPHKNIGWNIAVGGEREYDDRFHSKIFNFENELIDQELLQNKFLFENKRFSLLNLLIRNIFKPIINHWRKSNQSVVLANFFKTYQLHTPIDQEPSELIHQAWESKKHIFQGAWGAIPHDINAVALAITFQLQSQTLELSLRLKYGVMLGYLIEEILVNGKLYRFNQVDALLLDLIFIEYFTFVTTCNDTHLSLNI